MPESGADTADFEQLVQATYRLVYQVVYAVLANPTDVEEMKQEAFLRSYRKFAIAMATKKKLIIPKFRSEAEDARWHDRHKRELEAELRRRIKEGTTRTLAEVLAKVRKKEPLTPMTIRMRSDDIVTARGLAAQKGIGYQTYIKLLLREALQHELGKRRR